MSYIVKTYLDLKTNLYFANNNKKKKPLEKIQ